jgi:hypothetical protein
MKLDDLTDEELTALEEAIRGKRGAVQPAGQVDDQAAEDDRIEQLCAVVESQQAKIAAMDEEIDMLIKLVQEEIIDKVRAGVEENEHANGIKSLQDKYGEKFGPHKDFYASISGGADIYEKLLEDIAEAKEGKESWSDEDEAGHIDGLLGRLSQMKEGVKGSLGESTKPEGLAVEVKKVEAAPVSGTAGITEMVKQMKKRGIPGMPRD